jgi:hypothetical protein
MFKQRMAGRYYNSMTLDHRVAQCRDLMKCWKCNTFGHISSSCGSSRRHGGLASHATHSQTRAFHSASRVLASVPSLNSTPEKKSFVDVLLSTLPPPHSTHPQPHSPEGANRNGVPLFIRKRAVATVEKNGATPCRKRCCHQGLRGELPRQPRFHPRSAFKLLATNDDMH